MKFLRFRQKVMLMLSILATLSSVSISHKSHHPKSRSLLQKPSSKSLTGLSLFEELSDLDKTLNEGSVSLKETPDKEKKDERKLANQLVKKKKTSHVEKTKKKKERKLRKKVHKKNKKRNKKKRNKKIKRKLKQKVKKSKKKSKHKFEKSLKKEIEEDLWKMLQMKQKSKKKKSLKKKKMNSFIKGLLSKLKNKKSKKKVQLKKKKIKKRRKLKKLSKKKSNAKRKQKKIEIKKKSEVMEMDKTLQFLGGGSYESNQEQHNPVVLKAEETSSENKDNETTPKDENEGGFLQSISNYFWPEDKETPKEETSSKSTDDSKKEEKDKKKDSEEEKSQKSEKSAEKASESVDYSTDKQETEEETEFGFSMQKILEKKEVEEEPTMEKIKESIETAKSGFEELDKLSKSELEDINSEKSQKKSRKVVLSILTEVRDLTLITEKLMTELFLSKRLYDEIYEEEVPLSESKSTGDDEKDNKALSFEEWRAKQSFTAWVHTVSEGEAKETFIKICELECDQESIDMLNEIQAFKHFVWNDKEEEKRDYDFHDLVLKFTINPEHSEFPQKIMREFEYLYENYDNLAELGDFDNKNFPKRSQLKEINKDLADLSKRPPIIEDETESQASDQKSEQSGGSTSAKSSEKTPVSEDKSEQIKDSQQSDQASTQTESLETKHKYKQIETSSHTSQQEDNESPSTSMEIDGTQIESTVSSSKTQSEATDQRQSTSSGSNQDQSSTVDESSISVSSDKTESKLDQDEDKIEKKTVSEQASESSEELKKDLVSEIIEGEQSELQKEFEEDQKMTTQSIPHGHDFSGNQRDQPILPNNHIDDHPMLRDPYKNRPSVSSTQEYSQMSGASQQATQQQYQEEQSDESLSELAQKLRSSDQIDANHVISLPIVDPYQSQKGLGKGMYQKGFINFEDGIKQSGNEDLMQRNYLIQKYGEQKAKEMANNMQIEDQGSYQTRSRIPVVDMSNAGYSEMSSSPVQRFDHHPEGINIEHVMNLGKLVDQNEDHQVDLNDLMENLENHNIGSFEKGQMGTGQTILMKPLNTQISKIAGSYTSGNRVPLHQRFKSQPRIPVISVKSVKQMMDLETKPSLYTSHHILTPSLQPVPQKNYPCPQPMAITSNVPISNYTPIQQIPVYSSPPPQMYQYNQSPQYNYPNQYMPDGHYEVNTTVTAHPENEQIAQFTSMHPRESYNSDMGDSLVDSLFYNDMGPQERRLSLKSKVNKKKKKDIKPENLRSKVSSKKKGKKALKKRRSIQPENLRRKVLVDTRKKKLRITTTRVKIRKKEHLYRGKHKAKLHIYSGHHMKIPVITINSRKHKMKKKKAHHIV